MANLASVIYISVFVVIIPVFAVSVIFKSLYTYIKFFFLSDKLAVEMYITYCAGLTFESKYKKQHKLG